MSIKKIFEGIVHSENPVLYNIRQFLMGFPLVENLIFHANMSDEEVIRRKYYKEFGTYPNLENPHNFNEKNNWRKLHDRKNIYTLMVDKYRVKNIIEDSVGKEHTFTLLGVWEKPNEIDFDELPEKFVLKCNHAGGVIICRDKSSFDKDKAIKKLSREQKRNYYIRLREWPYKNVEKKIIAEAYMGENLIDYKNYCFDGQLMYTLVWQNHSRKDGYKPEAHFCGSYDRNWKKTDMELDYPTDDVVIEKPQVYDQLVEVVEKMSKGIPFVRVDCYIINEMVYVGEMTFYPWGGFQKFKNEKWNEFLGEMEKLPL